MKHLALLFQIVFVNILLFTPKKVFADFPKNNFEKNEMKGSGNCMCDPAMEREILIEFYNNTHEAGAWSQYEWNLTQPVSSWTGVTLDGNGCVKCLDLDGIPGCDANFEAGGNNLKGEIPSSIGQLENLQTLSLGENQLYGSIPNEIGNLSNLEYLHLGRNDFSGPIPIQLGQLNQLRILWLFSNDLTGTIPPSLFDLNSLTWLGLDNNSQLTGGISTQIGNLQNLTVLGLGSCNLTGEIPSQLGQIQSLDLIALDGNRLSGCVPGELGQLNSLTRLYLADNQLSGYFDTGLMPICNLGFSSDQIMDGYNFTGNPGLAFSGDFSQLCCPGCTSINAPCDDEDPNTLNDQVAGCNCLGSAPTGGCASPNDIFCETFENYNSQSPLGPQSENWTTWPGAQVDGIISTIQASSGNKSLELIGGIGQDVLLLLGNLTSGRYRLRHKIFIPNDNSASYNVQHFETAGQEWAFEVSFDAALGGRLFVGGQTINFNFPNNTWFKVDQVIDIDNDWTTIMINGVQIHSWSFSSQVTSAVGTNQLGAINYWPVNEFYNFYVDDIYLEALPVCNLDYESIICDDFEFYQNESLIGPQSSFWSTWSGFEGTTEDAITSNNFSFSANHSMLIAEDRVQDVVLLLGNRTEGCFELEWQMYIPSGADGYYNFQGSEVSGQFFELQNYLQVGGNGQIVSGAAYNFPSNTWFEIKHKIDLDNDEMEVSINGLVIETNFPFDRNLGSIDFYSIGSINRYYVDNILVKQVECICSDPGTCDDGDCTNGFEVWNTATCSCNLTPTNLGCTNPLSQNYDENADCDDGSCLCTPDGCIEEGACNYNPAATCNDGSCIYEINCDDGDCTNGFEVWDDANCGCSIIEPIFGCTNPSAPNYNPLANCELENSCECIPDGCVDMMACNFNPDASCDDGSCITATLCDTNPCTDGGIYVWSNNTCSCILNVITIVGCMDSNSSNFDPSANCSNPEDCECEGPTDCEDNDCSTIDTYNTTTCECVFTLDPNLPLDCDDEDCTTLDSYDTTDCECVHETIAPLNCDDGDCSTVDTYDTEVCECVYNTIMPQSCDDGDCTTLDSYDTTDCGCVHETITPLNCDDGDCNTIDTYDTEVCECVYNTIMQQSCDDGDCRTLDSYDTTDCECVHETIAPLNCDDGDCNTVDTYDTEVCECVYNTIMPQSCDDGDCTTLDSYDTTDCECVHETIAPLNCDDSDCTNGFETWNPVTCECIVEQPILGCADSNACNYNPTATCDDGSCITITTCDDNGCTNGGIYVWNPTTCECVLDEITIEGCVNPTACNYNPSANCNDFSCVFQISCDDGNCTNGQEFWNSNTCACDVNLSELSANIEIITEVSCSALNIGEMQVDISSGEGEIKYEWEGPDGFTSNQQNLTGLISGVYTVTVTDENICIVENIMLSAPENPIVEFDIMNVSCIGETGTVSVDVVNNRPPPFLYRLNGAEVDFESVYEGLSPGIYELNVIDGEGCESFTNFEITQPDHEIPQIISSDEDLIITQGEEITLEASVEADTYRWTTDGEGVLNCDNCRGMTTKPIRSATTPSSSNDPVQYVLETQIDGCHYLDTLSINIRGSQSAFVITCNDDGINDALFIPELEDDLFDQNNELVIFNRWGEIVFTAKPYNNDWCGIDQQGNTLAEGTYYFIIRLDISRGVGNHGRVVLIKEK